MGEPRRAGPAAGRTLLPVRAIVWRGTIDDRWRKVARTRLPADRDGLRRLVSYRALGRPAYLRREGQQDAAGPADRYDTPDYHFVKSRIRARVRSIIERVYRR